MKWTAGEEQEARNPVKHSPHVFGRDGVFSPLLVESSPRRLESSCKWQDQQLPIGFLREPSLVLRTLLVFCLFPHVFFFFSFRALLIRPWGKDGTCWHPPLMTCNVLTWKRSSSLTSCYVYPNDGRNSWLRRRPLLPWPLSPSETKESSGSALLVFKPLRRKASAGF